MLRSSILRRHPLLLAVSFTAVLAALILGFTSPFWETNDDIGMAMVTGGRGFVTARSPGVLISNIAYSWVLSVAPDPFGRASYDLISYGLDLVAVAAIAYALLVLVRYEIAALAITGIVSLRMLMFPQFTLLAGGLAVAGILLILAYSDTRRRTTLIVAAMLLILSYLVRPVAFVLMLPLAGFALSRRRIVADRAVQAALAVVFLAVVAAAVGDYLYYARPEWAEFLALNAVRAPFTDFSAANQLLGRPDLLQAAGLSPNDVRMLQAWWLIDPDIANPERLRRLLAGLDLRTWVFNNIDGAVSEFKVLFTRVMLILVLPAALMTALARHRLRVGLVWAIALAAILAIGLSGRHGTNRIYYPLIAFVLCFAAAEWGGIRWRRLAAALLLAVAVWAGYAAVAQHRRAAERATLARQDMERLDLRQLHVIWGSAFPFEAAFPVFTPATYIAQFRWYGLGVLTRAPYVAVDWDGHAGLIDRLLNGKPVSIFANETDVEYLRIWCAEHHRRKLRIEETERLNTMTRYTLTCREPM
jgi:hypothetical protein